jgi:hypothetical protein
MLSSDVRASADTGVCGTWSCVQETTFTSLVLEAVTSAKGFGISLSTLSGLKGNKPALTHPARRFLDVSARSLAGLYR